MIKWFYDQAFRVTGIEKIYVATDNERIKAVCKSYAIPIIMTSAEHPTHVHRMHEVSEIESADYYVVIYCDEPFISNEKRYSRFTDAHASQESAKLIITSNIADLINANRGQRLVVSYCYAD